MGALPAVAGRGKGYRPDPTGHRKTPFAHLAVRLRAKVADRASVLYSMPAVFDQGQSGACVGHAMAAAITSRMRVAGAAPSPAWVASPANIYTLARAIDRGGDGLALTDDGCEPNQAIRGPQEWGIAAIGKLASDGRYSDVELATVNDEPDLLLLESDAEKLVVSAYAIASTGAARRGEIASALANGIAVCVAVDASDGGPLQNYTSGVLNALGSTLDHYVAIAAYDGGTGDGMVCTVRNSWSAAFGESGNFRVGGAALDELGDLYAMDLRGVA